MSSSQSFSSTLPLTLPTNRPTTPPSLPLDVPIEEETMPGYDFKDFHHPNPGDILDGGRFELIVKLGFGSSSTVWLARDKKKEMEDKMEDEVEDKMQDKMQDTMQDTMQDKMKMADIMEKRWEDRCYVAIKICTSNFQNQAASEHELRISNHIVECAPGDESKYLQLRTVQDSFAIQGTHGTHTCLVMEPMREPIWLMRRRLTKMSKATAPTLVIFKMFLQNLVGGLEYLHECNVVHTGK
ncbi:hypothetical protein EJ08DRAFT_693481 [Tothia fuscella]|uniref:non-specific serine/threonine protein kinase n=1 Tax=Tothia fuscella TaxID=1048955 RepID=A0A9P4NZC7_9PEZI|nr:hypothetical protein EJ08DRAFT_693481 [Tothia fuscella]